MTSPFEMIPVIRETVVALIPVWQQGWGTTKVTVAAFLACVGRAVGLEVFKPLSEYVECKVEGASAEKRARVARARKAENEVPTRELVKRQQELALDTDRQRAADDHEARAADTDLKRAEAERIRMEVEQQRKDQEATRALRIKAAEVQLAEAMTRLKAEGGEAYIDMDALNHAIRSLDGQSSEIEAKPTADEPSES